MKSIFYKRNKRHVRDHHTGKSHANRHPALIVGEKGDSFYSMGFTSSEPKRKKKFIERKQKTKDGKTSWLSKRIENDKKSKYSKTIKKGFYFSEKEQLEIDKRIESKKRYLEKKE